MKESPEVKSLNTNLHASKFSGDGFLGSDQRPINEIISADMHQLEDIGRTIDEVVELLEKAYQKIRLALGNEIELGPDISGKFYESMGRIPSPFPGDGVFEKGEAVISQKSDDGSGESIVLTELGIHLIEKYHFFQGMGSRYRIEPVAVFRLLSQ